MIQAWNVVILWILSGEYLSDDNFIIIPCSAALEMSPSGRTVLLCLGFALSLLQPGECGVAAAAGGAAYVLRAGVEPGAVQSGPLSLVQLLPYCALIGPAPTLLCSHWSRASLVMLAPTILYCREIAKIF